MSRRRGGLLGRILRPLTTSFRAKLAAALLGTVILLLGATLVAIQRTTGEQVDLAVERASARARAAFSQWEALRVAELERLARPFTGSIRSAVLLDEASRGGDLERLSEEAEYELQRSQIDTSLVTFADPSGRPLFTLLDGAPTSETDPAGISGLVRRLRTGSEERIHGYRTVGEQLVVVQVEPVYLGPDPVGHVGFGSPVTDADARRLGDVTGAEVCLVVEGRCAAGTPGATGGLRTALVEAAGRGEERSLEVEDDRWRLVSDPLVPDQPEEGLLAMAVPLDPVLAPYQTIVSVLVVAGLVALAVAVLLSLRLSRGLTGPVRALVGAAKRVGGGDYSVTVDVDARDELGTLAGAFNDMTAGLRLKEKYRGVLDKVVSPEVAEELLAGEIRLGGETREATVFFADLRGFTALTEHMPPAEVVDLLNECMERLTEAVEAEGGVVDKYVGDQLMAIFGAPVARGDEALRACRAAARVQRSIDALNREREVRGEEVLGVGVGIGTGPVVAGNVGTPDRLDYTVLGATVNLGARLCATAAAGEVLLSDATFRAVEGRVVAERLPPVALKGFSQPVEVYEMTSVSDRDSDERAGARTGTGPGPAALLLAGFLAIAPGSLPAQDTDGAPTLRDLGLSYASSSGFVQLQASGRMELEYYLPAAEPSWIVPSTDPFFAPRARVLAELFVGSRVHAAVELRGDRGEAPAAGDYDARVDQAYIGVQPFRSADLHLQAGKFASPFGGYPARHHTIYDPFVRPPLPYDWRTTVPTHRTVESVEEFVSLRSPANGSRAGGAPIVWGVPYQWGVQTVGSVGDLTFRGGTVNSAPAGSPDTWALGSAAGVGSTWVAGLGYRVTPELHVDVSWSRGPYLPGDVEGLSEGRSFDDHHQRIAGVEMVFARGPIMLRGEFFDDAWEVPNLEYRPRDRSWYLEGELDLLPGLRGAVRYGAIHFSSISDAAGPTGPYDPNEPWDWDVRRLEIASGYRIAGNVGIQAQYARNRTLGASEDPADDLAAIQLWWRY